MLTLGTVPPRPQYQPPIMEGETIGLEWDARLSLDMIRTHTKTVDVLNITDPQLLLYRASAIEAAEMFTGMLLTHQRTITEPVQGPPSVKYGKHSYRHTLQYPSADGIIYLYGSIHAGDNSAFTVKPGSRSILVPIRTGQLDLSNCCDPCASHHFNAGMMIAYRAGFADVNAVPAGIVHGILLYISWAVEHPGDELLTQRNRIETRAGLAGLQGSNNIAMISGALEMWRQYDNEAL